MRESELLPEEILLVDDTPANIEVLRGMLEADGYRISAAPSGEIALRIAPRLKPALVLLDVMMPGLSGYETCRRLRATPETAGTPIVFVTASHEVADLVEGFAVGGHDYISKPFRQEEVAARVRTHLELNRRKRELEAQGERLRAIVNNIADGILIYDAEGLIRYLNPAAEHLLGQTGASLCGTALERIMAPELAAQLRAGPSAAWHGSRECALRRTDGGTLTVDLAVNPTQAGEPLSVAVFRDATARKETEDVLRRLALSDALTDLGNRRHFDQRLEEECRRSRRHGQPLALLLVDVDHFKAFNDHYGHQAGDHCLQEVAAVLKALARRPGDLAARYGGEEFVLLLPQTDQAGAELLAERLVSAVAERRLRHIGSPTAPVLTVSVGLACADPVEGHSGEALLARADRALYAAKHAGRNGYRTA